MEKHFSYPGCHGGKLYGKKWKRRREISLHMLAATLICVGLTGLVGEIM